MRPLGQFEFETPAIGIKNFKHISTLQYFTTRGKMMVLKKILAYLKWQEKRVF
jgi:hypothetical protein